MMLTVWRIVQAYQTAAELMARDCRVVPYSAKLHSPGNIRRAGGEIIR